MVAIRNFIEGRKAQEEALKAEAPCWVKRWKSGNTGQVIAGGSGGLSFVFWLSPEEFCKFWVMVVFFVIRWFLEKQIGLVVSEVKI